MTDDKEQNDPLPDDDFDSSDDAPKKVDSSKTNRSKDLENEPLPDDDDLGPEDGSGEYDLKDEPFKDEDDDDSTDGAPDAAPENDFDLEEEKSEAEKQKERIDDAIKAIVQGQKECPGIPVIMMFGYSTSGKSTLAYRLQEDARLAGHTVKPEVWKQYDNTDDGFDDDGEIYSVGTTAMHAYVFSESDDGAPQSSAAQSRPAKTSKKLTRNKPIRVNTKSIKSRQIIIDCPGEYWRQIVKIDWEDAAKNKIDPSLNNLLSSMLTMMSLCSGYIFAIESEQIFSDFIQPKLDVVKDADALEQAQKKARSYKQLYKNIALITDLDTRLMVHLEQTKSMDKAIAALVADKGRASALSTKMNKPVFVAFTKTDALAHSILHDFIKRNTDLSRASGGAGNGLLERLSVEINDYDANHPDTTIDYGPSTILELYAEEILAFCLSNPSTGNNTTKRFIDGYDRPAYGAVMATPTLFSQLCQNARYLRFDFVSPFDGMKERLQGGRELPPLPRLRSYGIRDNLEWLRKLAIQHSTAKPRSAFLQRFTKNDTTQNLAKLWIANSDLVQAKDFRGVNLNYKPTLTRKVINFIIGGVEGGLKPKLGLNHALIAGSLMAPVLIFFSLSAGIHKTIGQDNQTSISPQFNLSFEDVTTKELLAEVKAELGTGRLIYDGYARPWRTVPSSGMSRIKDSWERGGQTQRCNDEIQLCRANANAFRQKLAVAGDALGNVMTDPDVQKSEQLRETLADVLAPDRETAAGSGNTKTFLDYHHGLLGLYWGNMSQSNSNKDPRDQFTKVIEEIEMKVTYYPYRRGAGGYAIDNDTPTLLDVLVATNARGAAQENIARLIMLHIASLHNLGLVELNIGNYGNASVYFNKASYLASYQKKPEAAVTRLANQWIAALERQERVINQTPWSIIENNRILAEYRQNEKIRQDRQSSMDLILQAVLDFEALALSANTSQRDAQIPIVNARVLRALLEVSDTAQPELSKAVAQKFRASQGGNFAQDQLRDNNNLASILLADKLSEDNLDLVASAYEDNANFQKLIASLRARESINETSRVTLFDNGRLIQAREIGRLETTLGRDKASVFLTSFEGEVGQALTEQSIEAYKRETSLNGRSLINNLKENAPWLSDQQKIELRLQSSFGYGMWFALPFLLLTALLGLLAFLFLRNTQKNYDRVFTSHHVSDITKSLRDLGLGNGKPAA